MSLEIYRKEINKIDKEIVTLFLKRMKIVENVAAYKIENNMQVLQPEREKELVEILTNDLEAPDSNYVTQLYTEIMRISREKQTEIIENLSKKILTRKTGGLNNTL